MPRVNGTASDAITAIAYLPEARELRLSFGSGRTYAYCAVPQSLVDAFMASPSRLTFFNIAIRGRFRFHEVSPISEAS